MSKRWGILVAVLCTALTFGGCAQSTDIVKPENQGASDTQKAEENGYQAKLDAIQPAAYGDVHGLNLEPGTVISIIGRGNSNAYWKEIQAGARQAVEDINAMMGYKNNEKVVLNYSAPETANNVDDQVNILDEELDRYPAAVGIAAVDQSACEVQFDLAAENKIPIVAFDSGTDYQKIVCMVDTNNAEAARTAAGKLCDSMGNSGQIAVFVHDSNSTSASLREAGFLAEIQEKHPEVSVVKVFHLDDIEAIAKEMKEEKEGQTPDAEDGQSDPQKEGEESTQGEEDKEQVEEQTKEEPEITPEEAIQYILKKNPEIKGCFATNEKATKLLLDVLESDEEIKNEDIKIVSFDGGEDQMKRLEEGKISGLIVQNPYGMGYATVVASARAILEIGNEALVDTGYTWVTNDNRKDGNIQKMLY